MLRGEDHEGSAPDGIRSGGEDLERIACFGHEAQSGTLGSADPVALHRFDPVWPIDRVESTQQFFGVVGDPEIPLFEVAFIDLGSATLANIAFQHLFIGENGLIVRAPPDQAVLAIGQAAFQHPAGKSTGSSDRTPDRW